MQGRFNILADSPTPEDAQKRLARGNSVASLIDKSAAPSATALLPSLKVPRSPLPPPPRAVLGDRSSLHLGYCVLHSQHPELRA